MFMSCNLHPNINKHKSYASRTKIAKQTYHMHYLIGLLSIKSALTIPQFLYRNFYFNCRAKRLKTAFSSIRATFQTNSINNIELNRISREMCQWKFSRTHFSAFKTKNQWTCMRTFSSSNLISAFVALHFLASITRSLCGGFSAVCCPKRFRFCCYGLLTD